MRKMVLLHLVTPGQSQKEIPNLIHFTMQALKMNLPDLCRQLDSQSCKVRPSGDMRIKFSIKMNVPGLARSQFLL